MNLYQRDDWNHLPVHPAADVFPLMSDQELAQMVSDLAEKGYDQQFPVILHEGQVLDGRNRLRACRTAGVDPWFQEFDGDGVAEFVVRANLNRRHLTPGQAAFVAAQLEPMFTAEAKERQRQSGGDRKSEEAKSVPANLREPILGGSRNGEAVVIAAKVVGVGETNVRYAKKLMSEAPELAKEVQQGTRSMWSAINEYRKGKEMSEAVVKPRAQAPKRPMELELEGYEAIIEGKMEAFLEAAHALHQIRERKLYLEKHGDYYRYLRDRWGISSSQCRQALTGESDVKFIQSLGEQK